ncbi:Glutaredoxin [Desulfotomaculum arcticum]|uniref:Glutaredoxin n=1 Tax=Desulfotruncus arcticus DSM 17038 TaxID=1121424 RepID=A0A1I2YJB2_9FIRM|nr:glutaredoxin domain-containing protein [Desulfotruncus arcticus]SFH25713.1 Glutaredoxin [Desulfotomaculum arcticum] [Desulfotruncus arcticus DSM 17038]
MAQSSKRSYAWSILIIFLVVGWIFPVIGIVALVCMLAPIMVALFTGKRKWCALFCPRGIFSDVILAKLSRNRKAPAILTSNAFKIGFLIFLIANLTIGIIYARGNWAAIGFVFIRLVSLTTAIAIVLGYMYSQRTWCGFCPMGFLATQTIKAKRLLGFARKLPENAERLKRGVILYTGKACPACKKLKEQLDSLGTAYQEVNIDRDKTVRQHMVKEYGSANIPSLVIDNRLIKNIDQASIQAMFNEKRSERHVILIKDEKNNYSDVIEKRVPWKD